MIIKSKKDKSRVGKLIKFSVMGTGKNENGALNDLAIRLKEFISIKKE